jgi:hypothetical protein
VLFFSGMKPLRRIWFTMLSGIRIYMWPAGRGAFSTASSEVSGSSFSEAISGWNDIAVLSDARIAHMVELRERQPSFIASCQRK